MTTQEDFDVAKGAVENLATIPDTDDLLSLYGLYKQATAGDVVAARPGKLDFKGRAKYDAWAVRKGMTAEVAMREYVSLVNRLKSKGA